MASLLKRRLRPSGTVVVQVVAGAFLAVAALAWIPWTTVRGVVTLPWPAWLALVGVVLLVVARVWIARRHPNSMGGSWVITILVIVVPVLVLTGTHASQYEQRATHAS